MVSVLKNVKGLIFKGQEQQKVKKGGKRKMDLQVDLVQCNRCNHIREKFLVGCPKCGNVENRKYDPNERKGIHYYKITLDVIKQGADFYKKELEDEQRKWFKEKIPSGQSWQCYAGMILANMLAILWIKDIVKIEIYSQTIGTTNSRIYYIMSFMTEEKQQLFCDFLNTFNPEGKKDEGKGDSKTKDAQTDVGEHSS